MYPCIYCKSMKVQVFCTMQRLKNMNLNILCKIPPEVSSMLLLILNCNNAMEQKK